MQIPHLCNADYSHESQQDTERHENYMNLHENLYRPALNYIKKERFTGSDTGIRFMFEKKKEEEKEVILACVWPEPFSYDKTGEEKKEYKEFEMTDEGLQEAIEWVESKHELYGKELV